MSSDSENGVAPNSASQVKLLVDKHYGELYRYAFRKIAREGPGQSLDADGLVNELVIRLLASDQPVPMNDSNHFMATAKIMMKHILTDRARRKETTRAGGKFRRRPLDSDFADDKNDFSGLLVFQEELRALAKQNPGAARVVELRCQGYSIAEAGKMVGVSRSTAYQLWQVGRDWLINSLIDPNLRASSGNGRD